MSRIRAVKPELFKHVGLYEAEIAHQLPLRLAFIALFTCCDRMGRFRWDPRRLKLDILPYDDFDVSQVLEALVASGFVMKYEYQAEIFGCIPSWHKHQKPNHREMDSVLPGPDGSKIDLSQEINENNDTKEKNPSALNACLKREARVNNSSPACPGGIWNMEVDRERDRERNNPVVASVMRPAVDEGPIQKAFQHWKIVMNHIGAKLDHKRKSVITKALKAGYSVEQLCDAITGCSYTPHNMGQNDRNQRYDGLHVILRDGDQIDRFIRNYQHPPRPLSNAERWTQANVHALQGWMKNKLHGEEIHGSV